MAKAKKIVVKESLVELKKELKRVKPIFISRLQMLIVIKQSKKDLSKNALAELVGVNHNSIQKWRKEYESNGLIGLLTHRKTGFKKSVVSAAQHNSLKEILTNPNNGIVGYTELQRWYQRTYKFIPYTTLVGYCKRHFKSKIKIARKSHIKKDEKAVETFKKTLVSNSMKD